MVVSPAAVHDDLRLEERSERLSNDKELDLT